MTEEQLEQETLAWLQDVGYIHRYGPDIAVDGSSPERADYRQVVLPFRLREAINRLATFLAKYRLRHGTDKLAVLKTPARVKADKADKGDKTEKIA